MTCDGIVPDSTRFPRWPRGRHVHPTTGHGRRRDRPITPVVRIQARRPVVAKVMPAVGLAAAAVALRAPTGLAQGRSVDAPAQRRVIPYLANATRRGDLDFTAAECDVVPNGERMVCRFRQVFLTQSGLDAKIC